MSGLAAVIADPHDEQARLAYARSIAASDPARAEFIEIEIQLAHWRKQRVRPADWDKLQLRDHALRTDHREKWAADVRGLVDSYNFYRGFVEEVTLPASKYLASATELYRRAPILHLNLTDVRPVAAELFASPHLARIVSLGLVRNGLGDAEAALLAASPHVANLTWLDLRVNQIGRAGLEALAASRHLPKLRYLGFEDNAIPDPTPQHGDEYDAETPLATELQQKYGKKPWLSVVAQKPWPPPRDAA